MNKDKIIELFSRYGFEYKKNISNCNFVAFTFKSGFFNNAELVAVIDGSESKEQVELDMNSSAIQLEKLGFSTKKSFYNSFEEMEETLFNGFFHVKDWRSRINDEYESHSQKILSSLPKGACNYDYIKVKYSKNNVPVEDALIEDVFNEIQDEGPKLIIIEAPAGFGKTCTSYEIIKRLSDCKKNSPLPFFTEFSRDRQARVFSHILIREVDRTFNSVRSDTVLEEVKQGRIAIVLDGFDEILHDNSSENSSENFEEAEPMLETIGELLTGNAKIILTSRRSAIFDGEVFDEWSDRYNDKFKINRYRLETPVISDWIPEGRLRRLNATDIEMERLSNPVLLSYLRFVSCEMFDELCENTEMVVEHYFKSMLEREIGRQELRMTPDQQSDFLRIVANDMCDNDYTSDSKDALITTIKEKAGHLINEVRKLYPPKDRPTLDKMATTLSNHAFFDRSSGGNNQIEFINEFVFGNYIADNILEHNGNWLSADERFVEPAILSYVPRSSMERRSLWNGLSEMKEFLAASPRMRYEWQLNDRVVELSYDDSEISHEIFKSTSLFETGSIKNSVFLDCSFTNVEFYFSSFSDITFINCKFWECSSVGDSESISFYNCKQNNELYTERDDEDEVLEEGSSHNLSPVEEYILNKIWPVGSNALVRLHIHINTIIRNEEFSKKEVIKGIKLLKKKELFSDANNVNFIEINKDRFSDIKLMLGRD